MTWVEMSTLIRISMLKKNCLSVLCVRLAATIAAVVLT